MNFVKKAVKAAIILLSLLILLTGCLSDNSKSGEAPKSGEETSNIHSGEQPVQQNEKDKSINSESNASSAEGSNSGDNIEDAVEAIAARDAEAAAEEKDTGSKIIEIIPMKELPDLTMEPQEPYNQYEVVWTPTLSPVYHKNFRYQIREFTRGPSRLVIDIGNTGSETIVITDDNFYFSILDAEGNECAESKVQGAPVSIAPGEIKRVVVTAQDPDAGLVFLNFGGEDYTILCPYFHAFPHEEADIVDTRPNTRDGYVVYDDEGNPFCIADMAGEVIGNGKAKIMAEGVLPIENERIGPVDRGSGFLALVKVKIANTTDEVMTIDKLLSNGAGEGIIFAPSDLAVLGELALPSVIEPHSIAEGWVPFRVGDGREGYGIVFYTSHGGFVLNSVNSYHVLRGF